MKKNTVLFLFALTLPINIMSKPSVPAFWDENNTSKKLQNSRRTRKAVFTKNQKIMIAIVSLLGITCFIAYSKSSSTNANLSGNSIPSCTCNTWNDFVFGEKESEYLAKLPKNLQPIQDTTQYEVCETFIQRDFYPKVDLGSFKDTTDIDPNSAQKLKEVFRRLDFSSDTVFKQFKYGGFITNLPYNQAESEIDKAVETIKDNKSALKNYIPRLNFVIDKLHKSEINEENKDSIRAVIADFFHIPVNCPLTTIDWHNNALSQALGYALAPETSAGQVIAFLINYKELAFMQAIEEYVTNKLRGNNQGDPQTIMQTSGAHINNLLTNIMKGRIHLKAHSVSQDNKYDVLEQADRRMIGFLFMDQNDLQENPISTMLSTAFLGINEKKVQKEFMPIFKKHFSLEEITHQAKQRINNPGSVKVGPEEAASQDFKSALNSVGLKNDEIYEDIMSGKIKEDILRRLFVNLGVFHLKSDETS